ncbi:hypothetical protein OPV22_012179 [Ensete ventricosum]|uniref:Uncharacterized protein n=1 Tax=Ensete ventricosum TaxID=4639 RepID=A0AAV8QY70_ENSVE|nr:hypothetical protein OPV22_012179 [Ensete ventricosum]
MNSTWSGRGRLLRKAILLRFLGAGGQFKGVDGSLLSSDVGVWHPSLPSPSLNGEVLLPSSSSSDLTVTMGRNTGSVAAQPQDSLGESDIL